MGFIDIARKAGDEKLRYRFQEVNDKVDFFTFSNPNTPRLVPESSLIAIHETCIIVFDGGII